MSLNLTKAGIASLIGVGGVGGGLVTYKYGTFNKVTTIKEKLKGFAITQEDEVVWNARVATLNLADTNKLHESLA